MTDATTGGPAVTVPAATYAAGTAHMVRIRAHHGDEAGVQLVGLPAEHAWHTRDRLHAAFTNSALTWPSGPLTLAVIPHTLPVGDSGLDLAFALALLAATGQLPADRVTALACLGELGLDGSLRPVPGLPERARVIAAAAIPTTVVAAADLPAAVPILGGTVRAATSLADLVAGLRGTSSRGSGASPTAATAAGVDLAQVSAAHPGRRALEVAAAGGHHLALIGPPGCGGLLLARRLPGLLPDVDEPTADHLAGMYRMAQLRTPVLRRPPWQAPHHTSSVAALTGTATRPGAFGLAHGGVLLCEDAGEWPNRSIEALLSAMLRGQVVAADPSNSTAYPTRFQLVATGRDCPRAAAHRDGHCDCPPAAVARYRQRLAPLLDQVDIRVALPAPGSEVSDAPAVEASHTVAARVARARSTAAARWARYGLTVNREAGAGALGTDLARPWAAQVTALQLRPDAGALSLLGASRVLAVAWTLADLAGHDRPDEVDLAEAIALHGAALPDGPVR